MRFLRTKQVVVKIVLRVGPAGLIERWAYNAESTGSSRHFCDCCVGTLKKFYISGYAHCSTPSMLCQMAVPAHSGLWKVASFKCSCIVLLYVVNGLSQPLSTCGPSVVRSHLPGGPQAKPNICLNSRKNM